jgi:hypothetical protein
MQRGVWEELGGRAEGEGFDWVGGECADFLLVFGHLEKAGGTFGTLHIRL